MPGVAGQHHGVQPGDVDAELQGVRRRHARAGRRRTARAPARGAPRAGSRRGRSPPGRTRSARPRSRRIRRAWSATDSALRRDRTKASVRAPCSTRSASSPAASAAADRRSGAPCSPVRSVSGGSHSANVAPGRGEPSSVTAVDRRPDQPGGGRRGVGHGRRGQHEHRLGAVAAADPPQPAQHVPDVRAEHPAVGVALVDDDVGHPAQGAGPALVRRQDPAVQHVRVGHDPAGVPADPVALLAAGCPRRRRPGAPRGRPAPRPRPAGRGPAPWSGPGRARRPGGPRRAGPAPAAGRPATCPTPSRWRRRRAGPRARARRPRPGGDQGAGTPRSASRARRSGRHPGRPGRVPALADRQPVHVGDRRVLVRGAGQQRRQQLVTGERPAGSGCGGRRRHPSTVTPPGNRPAGPRRSVDGRPGGCGRRCAAPSSRRR